MRLKLMFDRENKIIMIIFGVIYIFMSISLKFELLIIRNKISSPDYFESY